jgi:hypothetical protein
MHMDRDKLYTVSKDQLTLVLNFFARIESKLSVVLAIDTGMLAVLTTDAPPLKALSGPMIATAALAILLLAASIFFLYKGAFPSLKGGHASLVYFSEIAARTEHQFIEQFKNQSHEQYINDLLGQVWRNSEILTAKFGALKTGFTLLAIAIVPWVLALALFAADGNQARSTLLH